MTTQPCSTTAGALLLLCKCQCELKVRVANAVRLMVHLSCDAFRDTVTNFRYTEAQLADIAPGSKQSVASVAAAVPSAAGTVDWCAGKSTQ